MSETQENQATPGKATLHLGDSLPEDQLHHDPLLDCLVELTRIHGRPSTRAALSAGLPLPETILDPGAANGKPVVRAPG